MVHAYYAYISIIYTLEYIVYGMHSCGADAYRTRNRDSCNSLLRPRPIPSRPLPLPWPWPLPLPWPRDDDDDDEGEEDEAAPSPQLGR